MNVMIFESRMARGNPGLVVDQYSWDDGEEEMETPVPWGYTTHLERVPERRGAGEAGWTKLK